MFAHGSGYLNDPYRIAGTRRSGIADMSFSAASGEELKNTGKIFIIAGFSRTACSVVSGWQFHYR